MLSVCHFVARVCDPAESVDFPRLLVAVFHYPPMSSLNAANFPLHDTVGSDFPDSADTLLPTRPTRDIFPSGAVADYPTVGFVFPVFLLCHPTCPVHSAKQIAAALLPFVLLPVFSAMPAHWYNSAD